MCVRETRGYFDMERKRKESLQLCGDRSHKDTAECPTVQRLRQVALPDVGNGIDETYPSMTQHAASM